MEKSSWGYIDGHWEMLSTLNIFENFYNKMLGKKVWFHIRLSTFSVKFVRHAVEIWIGKLLIDVNVWLSSTVLRWNKD